MICYVFKPIRLGKRARLYSGRYRLKADLKPVTVPLHLMDKQLAEAALRKIVKEKEQEAEGWLAPARVRDAAQKPLDEHLGAFVRDQIAKGRVARYVDNLEMTLGVLIKECGWKHAQQVTASSFVVWRQRQEKSPKTLNEYLGNAKAFLNWMVRLEFITANPLAPVEKTRTLGRETRARRSYSAEEIQRLLAVAGPRKVIYLTAVLTGLRRGELAKLKWADVHLDGPAPFILVRGANAKNHKEERQPLHTDLVDALRELRGPASSPSSLVFENGIPRTKRFYADLKAASVLPGDPERGNADFHSLRVTFNTHLGIIGAGDPVRMALMRHSDPRLTAKTYTDAHLLPKAQAVAGLNFHRKGDDSQIDSQELVPAGLDVAQPVTKNGAKKVSETLVKSGESHTLAPSVTVGLEKG
ncbi:MAG: site-specific integrase, partial [Proteobacteria bacterium]|nr:site-specific integrase [Pseudomonadota bacterium]